MTTRLYHSEDLTFQNDHTTSARPLPIKKLKLLQKVFETHIDDQRRQAMAMQEIMTAIRKEEENTDPETRKSTAEMEELYGEHRKRLEDMDLMDWNEVLIRGSLLALNVWGVKDASGAKVDVNREYVEDNMDVPTAQRICEIAGNFKTGELNQSGDASDAEGKAQAG